MITQPHELNTFPGYRVVELKICQQCGNIFLRPDLPIPARDRDDNYCSTCTPRIAEWMSLKSSKGELRVSSRAIFCKRNTRTALFPASPGGPVAGCWNPETFSSLGDESDALSGNQDPDDAVRPRQHARGRRVSGSPASVGKARQSRALDGAAVKRMDRKPRSGPARTSLGCTRKEAFKTRRMAEAVAKKVRRVHRGSGKAAVQVYRCIHPHPEMNGPHFHVGGRADRVKL